MNSKPNTLPPSAAAVELSSDLADALLDAVRIMHRLRAPDGCPWDREQTHQSLRKNLLEESYEVLEALDTQDDAALREELGDLLLQIIFHALIAQERGAFDLSDVARDLTAKLIRRHPHVFGDGKASTPQEALQSWHTAKRSEGSHTTDLNAVPKALPALMQASKIQKRASQVGFDWKDATGVLDKLDEELSELRAAIREGDQGRMGEELGDVLFVLACLGNHIGRNPELALLGTIAKFRRRFAYIEKRLAEQGRTPEQSTLKQMDAIWDEAKETERNNSHPK